MVEIRALAARGLTVNEIAKALGLSRHAVYKRAYKADIDIRREDPIDRPRDYFVGIGRASAASPKHHQFTDEERQRAAETRRMAGKRVS